MSARILIVDDVILNTMMLEDLLASLGDVELTSFNNPITALQWCETCEPDLILLDFVMPQMDGAETLARLRQIRHITDIPVIMVTAIEDRESRLKALEAGANDFVTKPFDELELLARSRSMLKLRAAMLEQRRLATVDELTGLPNRRHFMARLVSEAQRALRCHGDRLSMIMMDVDHFKHVNDTYGHLVGDYALKKAAEICSSTISRVDMLGRMGGEEFAVIMPETGLSQAQLGAERMRRAVETTPIRIGGALFNITISLGVAEIRDGDDPDRLRARADAALYLAKQMGRNRVCSELQLQGPVVA